MGGCSTVLALCISSFWVTVVAIKECEVCLLYFVLYPTVPSRCLQSLLYSLFEGDCFEILVRLSLCVCCDLPKHILFRLLFFSKKFLLPINSQVVGCDGG